MLSLTLSPRGALTHYFPLHGDPPPNELLDSKPSLAWDAEFPRDSEVRFASLVSGGKMREMTGRVFVTIGTATPDGKEKFDEEPIWGYFSYCADPEDRFRVQLYVSKQMFAKLADLVRDRCVPTLDLFVTDHDGIETALPDGCLAEWDNVKVPNLEIKWCTFAVALPFSKCDGSAEGKFE